MSTNDTDSYLYLNSDDKTDPIHSKLAVTATNIALNNFEWSYVTFVIINSTLLSGVELFLQMYRKSVIIGTGMFYPSFANKTRQFVLFGAGTSEIIQMLDWMRVHEFDNTGKYIVVCQSTKPQECDESEAIKSLWERKITNVVFLKWMRDVNGYTYFPLADENCVGNTPVKLNLNSCLSNDSPKLQCKPFYKKLENLHTCKIIVSTFIQIPYMRIQNGIPEGADGDLLGIIGEKLNASLQVMTPHIGSGWGKLENGTWSGSLADVYYDIANFSMTSAALTLARFSYFQISADYHTVSVVWVTHPAILKPSSLKLLYPFQFSTQMALVFSFLLVVMCALFIKCASWPSSRPRLKASRPQTSVIFNSWTICMGLPMSKMPKKPALVYMTIFWIWYCILIRTFYQVCLISALQGNYYYDEFDSIEDAIEAKYSFGGNAALKDFFLDQPEVFDNWVNVDAPYIFPTLVRLSEGMKFVLAMNKETAQSIVVRNKIRLHFLPEKIGVSPTVIMFKKFSPLASPINCILRRLTESGFSDKLYKDYASKTAKIIVSDRQSIKLEHYTGCYAILVFGWILSICFFFVEIYFRKICTLLAFKH